MNNSDFYKLHKKIGSAALNSRRKFIGMLPEAYKRKLHYRKPYNGSIHYYAAQLCGLSREQVNKVLNLDKKLESTPALHNLFTGGEVSHYKLDRVASIATPENEEELVQQVQLLSKTAVETMVRDFKIGLSEPINGPRFVPGHQLQDKMDELISKGLNVDDILLELLEQREENIQKEKDNIAVTLKPTKSRYINKRTQNIIDKEHGDSCSVPNCHKKAEHIHHTRRFALSKEHNPHFLAPLCKAHHEIAHAVDLKVQLKRL